MERSISSNPEPVGRVNIDVHCDLDWSIGVALLTVRDGLKLPVTVRVPMVALKRILAEMLQFEFMIATNPRALHDHVQRIRQQQNRGTVQDGESS